MYTRCVDQLQIWSNAEPALFCVSEQSCLGGSSRTALQRSPDSDIAAPELLVESTNSELRPGQLDEESRVAARGHATCFGDLEVQAKETLTLTLGSVLGLCLPAAEST
jgi:hypothetical protein